MDHAERKELYELFEDYFGISDNNYFAEQIKINNKIAYNPIRNRNMGENEFLDHLEGNRSYGIYTLRKSDSSAKFMCIDIDMPKDPPDAAEAWSNVIADTRIIMDELYSLEFEEEELLLEFSGAKGIHIFIFFENYIPSKELYRINMEIKSRCAGKVSKDFEVFPKQEQLSQAIGALGSLLKLPLALHLKSGKRSAFLDQLSLKKSGATPGLMIKNIKKIARDKLDSILGAITYESKTQTLDRKEIYNISESGYKLELLRNGCDFFKYCERQITEIGTLNHEARKLIMTICIKYGNEGKAYVHEWLSKVPGYDRQQTEYYMTSAMSHNYKPARCRSTIYNADHSFCPQGGLCENLKKLGFKFPVNPTALSAPIYKREVNDIDSPISIDHLSMINGDEYNGMVVEVPVKVTGNASDYKMAWKEVYCTCTNFMECDNLSCQLKNTGERNISLKICPETMIELSECITDAIPKTIQKHLFHCPPIFKKKSGVRFLKTDEMTVQKLTVSAASDNVSSVIKRDDLTGEISYDSSDLIDEFGYKPEDKLAYYAGSNLEIDKMYKCIASIVRHPTLKGQKVLVIHSAEPLEYDALQFDINNEEARKSLTKFASMSLPEILDDLTKGITKIYDRNDMLLTILLTYSSVIDFIFNNEHEQRGWVESIVIGDAGLGKTAIPTAIMKATGLGDITSGQTMTEAGLVGGVEKDKLYDVHLIKWGAYPANDRRLLVVDEAQNLSENAMLALRSARQSGEVRISKIVSGRRNARTRLIYISNAKNNKSMAQFHCGIESIAEILKDSDIRRFDLAVCVSSSQHDPGIVNRHWTEIDQESQAVTKITGEDLRNNILYAWTRTGENIHFAPDVEKYILNSAAPNMSVKYGNAKSVPLVNPSDARITIARLAVAMATLRKKNVLSEDYENITITKEYVDMVLALMEKVYDAEESKLNTLSIKTLRDNHLLKSEVKGLIHFIMKRVKAESVMQNKDERESLTYQVMMRLYNKTTVSIDDIVNTTNFGENNIKEIFNQFLKEELVYVENRWDKSYTVKEKFRELINIMFKTELLSKATTITPKELTRIRVGKEEDIEELKKELFGGDI